MIGTRHIPRWLSVGLLVGVPVTLLVSAFIKVVANLQQACTAPTWPALDLLVGMVALGGAAAGWWASLGGNKAHGFLAGMVTGLMVAAALFALPMTGWIPQQTCGTPSIAFQQWETSIETQTTVSGFVEITLLAALYGLMAAVFPGRIGQTRRGKAVGRRNQ